MIMAAESPKLVFVNRYFYPDQSATSQLLSDLAAALSQSQPPVHVICSRQRYDDACARLAAHENFRGVTIHRVWTSRFGRGRLWGRVLDYATFYCSSSLAMLRLLRRGDTLIAKTDPPLISIVAMLAAKLRGARLVNWLQDLFPEVASLLGANPVPRPLNGLLSYCRNVSLHSAVMNVVLGERMHDRLVRLGIPSSKIKIIQNWSEGAAVPIKTAHSLLRQRSNLSDKFVVGYSGNLGRAHEFETLLDAAEMLETDREIVFLMIGGGAGMEKLKQGKQARGLENLQFLPYQPRDRLSDSLAAADVHWVSLLPQLEGLIVPSKFYGILAAARPVIFIGDTDGEVPRAIRSAKCGFSIAVGDVKSLVAAVRQLKDDVADRDRLGENAYKSYREHYTAERAITAWSEVFKPAIPTSGAPIR